MVINTNAKKAATRKRRMLNAAAAIIKIVELPLLAAAYPHILVCRLLKKLAFKAMRLAFVENGYCGGCSKFRTKRCKKRVKNPYMEMFKDCYED